MRILQLTPGTGNFHCGSCLRDLALVRALRARGHEVLLVPLYLPLVREAPDPAGDQRIFFGGINVYLEQKYAFFRRCPRWLDRWLEAPWLLRTAARFSGMTTARDHGELTLSMLRGEFGHQAKELAALIDWLGEQPQPDVVCLSNSLLAGVARPLRQALRAPVVCTLQGEDAFLDALPEPYRQQAWELLARRCSDIDQFIAISRYFGDLMRTRLGFETDRLEVIHPGISLEGFEPAVAAAPEPALGFLTRMHAGKGLGILVEAFIRLKQCSRGTGLKLRVAGAMTPADRPFVRQLQQRLASQGLRSCAEFQPNLGHQAKLEFLRRLTVFSVPAHYGEAFGLYLLEALAAGVPVVQPRHGAFPEILAETGGGLLCEPNDPQSLADGIEQLLRDRDRARQLGAAGRQAVDRKFSLDLMADKTEALLRQVVDRGIGR